jgi:hypothetical protein
VALRFDIGFLGYLSCRSALASLGFQGVRNVTAFGAGRFATRLVAKAYLHGVITITFDVANLQNRAGAQLQDGYRRDLAFGIENLGHAHFRSN